MRIVQSFWCCNQDPLYNKAGWLAPEYNLMGWALSCLQLKKYYSNVTLYTDSLSAKILLDKLFLPYDEVYICFDELRGYQQQLWALPKILTYSFQDKPFLHVDGDVFVWEKFSDSLLKSRLIAQNLEEATVYYKEMLNNIEKHLSYFPDEVKADRLTSKNIYAYNAGILGGRDIDFFQEYTHKAFQFISNNSNELEMIQASNFNIFYEQYLFYLLAKEKQIGVNVLINEIIKDNGYIGFGDFEEVPQKKRYLHLLGGYKRKFSKCRQMAYKLRQLYPEYYYRIIQLFKEHSIGLKDDYYERLSIDSQSYYPEKSTLIKLKPQNSNPIPVNLNRKHVGNNGYSPSKIFEKFTNNNKKIFNDIVNPDTFSKMKEDLLSFEIVINNLINRKFIYYDLEYLYARDLCVYQNIEILFSSYGKSESLKLIFDPLVEIVTSQYDWSEMTDDNEDLYGSFLYIVSGGLGNMMTAVIPECNCQGFSLLNIDELDYIIYQNLFEADTLKNATTNVFASVDRETAENFKVELDELILIKLKRALVHKIIKVL